MEEDLMKEVSSIMDGAVATLKEERQKEHLAILDRTTENFGSQVDWSDGEAHLFVLNIVPVDEQYILEAETASGQKPTMEEVEKHDLKGGRFSAVGAFPEIKYFCAAESDLLIACAMYEALKQPEGYLLMTKKDGREFHAFSLGTAIMSKEQMPNGEWLVKYFPYDNGTPEEMYESYEGERKSIMKTLLFMILGPREMRNQHPNLYKGILAEMEGIVKQFVERLRGNDNDEK
jgi:hypothetical protein